LPIRTGPGAVDRRVPAFERRQADRAVLLEVAAVAHADPGEVEKLRRRGEHGGLVGLRDSEVLLDTAANAPEHAREVGEACVLRALLLLAPLRMVDVLL